MPSALKDRKSFISLAVKMLCLEMSFKKTHAKEASVLFRNGIAKSAERNDQVHHGKLSEK